MIVRIGSLDNTEPYNFSDITAELRRHPFVSHARIASKRVDVLLSREYVDFLTKDIAFGPCQSITADDTCSRQRWVIDLFDPTATKAMHIGHFRNVVLGNALGGLCSTQEGCVSYQSIVCDMGRAVAEAIAGYLTQIVSAAPSLRDPKPDHFVGQCYATYVSNLGKPSYKSAPADRPLGRELHQLDDFADVIIKKWFSADPVIIAAWRTLISCVTSGHQMTLEKCAIPAHTMLFESNYFPTANKTVENGIAYGLFHRLDDGRVVYLTKRKEYAHLPLVRTDGLPTQHMRMIAVWKELLDGKSSVHWLHILGNEWRVSTECRVEVLKLIGHADELCRYTPLFHGMVTRNGAKMSSAAGDAVLVDDEIEWISSLPELHALIRGTTLGATTAAHMTLAGFILSTHPKLGIHYARDGLLESRTNPSAILLSALCRSLLDKEQAEIHYDAQSFVVTYMALRCQALPVIISISWSRMNPEHLLRYLIHLASFYQKTERCSLLARLMYAALKKGLTAIGIVVPSAI